MNKKSGEYLSLGEKVFYQLRDNIVTGKILEGDKLVETQLAQKLKVSRTPVREALIRLEKEGFVEIKPHIGAFIKVIEEKDIHDYLEVREALEIKAVKLSCQRATNEHINKLESIHKKLEKAIDAEKIEKIAKLDEDFHEIIFMSTDNKLIYSIFNTIKDQMFRYRVLYLKNETDRSRILEEHKLIIDCIRNKDFENGTKVISKHVKSQKEKMKFQ